jgi:NAD(P)-dependent dehydrogenase (short-subunit alcohol dehydrogenase family)
VSATDRRGSGELAGKRVLITGASRGIGAATAIACAQAGAATVALLARTQEHVDRIARAVEQAGSIAVGRVCDVTHTAELQHAIESLGSIDVLVNCAGGNQPEPFLSVDEETLEQLWALNVRATFFASQAVAGRMVADHIRGTIVNVSSQMGHVGASNRTGYCTTKHAIEGFTKALAVELGAHGIRVVSIAPTFVRTDMTAAQLDDPTIGGEFLKQIPLGRFGTPEDVAQAIVFVASDRAALITGSSVRLDGGWTAR